MGSRQTEAELDAMRRLACRIAHVRLVSDMHERGCDIGVVLPLGAKRRARIARIEQAGLVFIHVPKTAGMSISEALYGEQVKHASIRLIRHVAGGRLARLPSFAVLRDPTERFLSAYRYGRAGGSASNAVAAPFQNLYRAFRSIDDALDYVERATDPYQVDHIFRPQHWYVTDRMGRVAVDRLVRMEDLPRLHRLVPGFPDRALPRLNRSSAPEAGLSSRQAARLRARYAADYALWGALSGTTVREKEAGPYPTPASRCALATA